MFNAVPPISRCIIVFIAMDQSLHPVADAFVRNDFAAQMSPCTVHWFPVEYRIKVKLYTLTYRALAIHQTSYMANQMIVGPTCSRGHDLKMDDLVLNMKTDAARRLNSCLSPMHHHRSQLLWR